MYRLIGSISVAFVLGLGGSLLAPRPASSARTFDGQTVFRFDTFGDEQFWTDTLRMHEVIQSSVSPRAALGVGLKVDSAALPPEVIDALKAGQIDLDDPAVTVRLLALNAVVYRSD